MKTLRTCLSIAALLALLGQPAMAQMPQPKASHLNAAMTKLFGDVKAFSSMAELHMKNKAGEETAAMTMNFAFLDGKVRTELDMSQMKSKDMPVGAGAMMKQMGMDKMVNIIMPEKKIMLMIYPGLKSYTEMPMPKEEAATAETKFKMDKEQLGKETVEGHPCAKCKVTMTGDKGEKHEALVWQATDLKDFPVQMQMTEGDNTMLMVYRDIKFAKPDAALFDAPTDCTKYDNMQAMMQGAMMKMMGGGK